MTSIHIDTIKTYFLALQSKICEAASKIENKPQAFKEDIWQREHGGGGITRVLEDGSVFEKAGVNFSHVFGTGLPASATAQRPELVGCSFEAMGVSVVMHPDNPYAPTSHMNVRFFIASKEGQDPVWWFGGGFDLTPYYVFEEDARAWHQLAADVCRPFDQPMQKNVYAEYKAACDQYFYLKHRQETRGIGGLFVDDLSSPDMQTCFEFIQAIGDGYIDGYMPIVEKRKNIEFSAKQKRFQHYRRGRYVEFNLVYDRGTLFGLQTGGRVESILMSLPSVVEWHYDWQAEAGSEEEKLQQYLVAKNWLD